MNKIEFRVEYCCDEPSEWCEVKCSFFECPKCGATANFYGTWQVENSEEERGYIECASRFYTDKFQKFCGAKFKYDEVLNRWVDV